MRHTCCRPRILRNVAPEPIEAPVCGYSGALSCEPHNVIRSFYFEPCQVNKRCIYVTNGRNRMNPPMQIVKSKCRNHHWQLLGGSGELIASFRAAKVLSYIVLHSDDSEELPIMLSCNFDLIEGRDDWKLPYSNCEGEYEVYRWSKAQHSMVRVVGRNVEATKLASLNPMSSSNTDLHDWSVFPQDMILKTPLGTSHELTVALCTAFISAYKWSQPTAVDRIANTELARRLHYEFCQCVNEKSINRLMFALATETPLHLIPNG